MLKFIELTLLTKGSGKYEKSVLNMQHVFCVVRPDEEDAKDGAGSILMLLDDHSIRCKESYDEVRRLLQGGL